MSYKITKQIEEEILNLQKNGGNTTTISKKLNLGVTTVWRILKQNKVILTKRKLDTLQEQNLILDYKNGDSSIKLAKKYNISDSVVRDYLSKNNTDRRKCIKYKYNPNELFFDEENLFKPEVLWVLGWLWADGYNNPEQNMFKITTHLQDTDVLLRIQKLLDGPIYTAKNYKRQDLHIFSHKLSYKLNNLGCMRAKSLIVKYPKFIKIDDDNNKYFIRGLLEGDGWISIRKNGSGCHCGIVSASKDLIYYLQDIIKNTIKIDATVTVEIKGRKNPIYKLIFGHGKYDTLKFLDWIYNDNLNYILDRKYNNYLFFKERLLNFKNFDSNKNRYREFYIISPEGQIYHVKGISQFAKEFGLSESMLHICIKHKKKVWHHKNWRLISPAPYLPRSEIIEKFY